MLRFALFLALLAIPPCAGAQTVHKWKDAQGNVHYGDRPPANVQAEPVRIAPPPRGAGQVRAIPATPTTPPTSEPTPPAAQPLEIVMYARADCGYCAKARRYFAQRGLRYVEKDVRRDAAARAEWQRLGGRGVPLFVINRGVSHGFEERGMTELLASYGW